MGEKCDSGVTILVVDVFRESGGLDTMCWYTRELSSDSLYEIGSKQLLV